MFLVFRPLRLRLLKMCLYCTRPVTQKLIIMRDVGGNRANDRLGFVDRGIYINRISLKLAGISRAVSNHRCYRVEQGGVWEQ
jgi:hypothetical protein